MASIINAGSGSNAELTEPYTTQASQHSLLFGIGGKADTKFPLPTGSSWAVVELHFIEGDGSTIAYTEWFDKLTDILARLIEIQDAIEADVLITNYKMVASHYDHTVANKVDVYRGEHLDGQAKVDIVLDSSGVDFTFPIGNWELSDTVLAPVLILSSELFADPDCDSAGSGVPCLGLNISATSSAIDGGIRYKMFTNNGEDLYTDAFDGVINGVIAQGDEVYMNFDLEIGNYDVIIRQADGVGGTTAITNGTITSTATGIQLQFTSAYDNPIIEFYSTTFDDIYIDNFSVKKEI